MTPKAAEGALAGAPPKNRACDQCRSRKIACSKEPDGCARCTREGNPCHYSPQKPMGRPRKKRQLCDEDNSVIPDTARTHLQLRAKALRPDQDGASMSRSFFPPPALPAEDPGVGCLAQDATSDMAFADLLLPGHYYDGGGALYDARLHDQPRAAQGRAVQPVKGQTALAMQGSDILQGAGFDFPEASAVSGGIGIDDGLPLHMASRRPSPCPDDVPSAIELPKLFPDGQAARATPDMTCGCLASLYLALDSLSHLPPKIAAAIDVARGACRVAQNVIECRRCSNAFLDDPLRPPPMQAFQNLTCLGALIPSACNVYASILEMVDRQTDAAKEHRRTIFFSLKEVGGPWERLILGAGGGDDDDGQDAFSAIRRLDNTLLDPDVWRAAIRTMLKLDIYGLGGAAAGPQGSLQDVLALLDDTSRRRHQVMGELMAAGQMPLAGSCYFRLSSLYPPCPPGEGNCARIVETARRALESLVIA